MRRRDFLHGAVLAPAAAALARVSPARAGSPNGDRWRVFEVTTRLQVLKPAGAVRAWVPGAAVDVLDDGARRLVLPLTRDREREVRDAAVTALVGLGPEAAKPIVPDLRKRLHSDDPEERIAAMSALGELGDRSAVSVLVERAETAQLPEERSAAERALRLVGGR